MLCCVVLCCVVFAGYAQAEPTLLQTKQWIQANLANFTGVRDVRINYEDPCVITYTDWEGTTKVIFSKVLNNMHVSESWKLCLEIPTDISNSGLFEQRTDETWYPVSKKEIIFNDRTPSDRSNAERMKNAFSKAAGLCGATGVSQDLF